MEHVSFRLKMVVVMVMDTDTMWTRIPGDLKKAKMFPTVKKTERYILSKNEEKLQKMAFVI